MTQEQLRTLLRLALKNGHMLDLVMAVIEDMVHVIVPTFARCQKESCRRAATVIHVDLNVKLCDRHAAGAIVKARADIRPEPDNLTIVRARLGDEECWIDLPNAERIRRLDEVLIELEKNDVDEFDSARYH